MGWDVSMYSPPQASGDSVEKTVRASGNRGHKETKPSEHSTSNTHMNSQRLWQHAQGVPESVQNEIPVLREEVNIRPNT